jgi:excisionase family DNA binding protein
MLLATKQAAERLGVHPATVRRWTASGLMRFVRVGRERAIPVAEVNRKRRERAQRNRRGER